MKKRNLVLQAAIAGLFTVASLSAFASGSLSNAIGNSAQIATQAVTSTSVIGSGSLTFTVSGSIPIGNYYVYVQLNNGATFADGAGGTFGGGSIVATGGALGAANTLSITPNGAGAATAANGTVLAGATNIVAYPINVTAALAANSTFTFKPAGVAATLGGISGASSAAGAGTLNATMSMGASASFFTTLTAIVTDEAAAATAPIVTFTSGVQGGALASSGFTAAGLPVPYLTVLGTEKAQIDVLNGATGSTLTGNVNNAAATSSETLDFGGFYFEDVNSGAAGAGPFGADATTAFTLNTDYVGAGGTISGTLTAPAGFFTPATVTGGSLFISTNSACTVAGGGTAAVAAGGATATFSFTTPAAAPIAGLGVATQSAVGPFYVCMTGVKGTQWVPGQPSIVPTVNTTTALAGKVASFSQNSTNLYNLQPNGGAAYVREYIPASVAPAYTSFIRVINTGNVSANVNAAIVSDVTGKTGKSGVIATAVPAGGAVTLTSSQIEAAIVTAGGVAPGGLSATDATGFRPRLYITAPTTIAVQSFILQSNGTFSEVSGGNVGNIGLPAVTGTNINPFNQ